MDRELKNLTLNISQLAALSGVHRQTAAARLQNLPVAGGHESNLKLYRVVDIVSAFLALPPPVAEGEMDAHERKAWYQSERERLKFEQETAQLIPASDVRREFAIWAKAVVQVLETLPDILERDCGLQPAAVSRVQSIIDDLRDQIALRVTEAGADPDHSRKGLVRGGTRKHPTGRLPSPSAMIITLTVKSLFRPLFLTVWRMTIRGAVITREVQGTRVMVLKFAKTVS